MLDGGETGPHRALMLLGWSDDVVLLTDGPAELTGPDRERLARAGVGIDERPVAGLVASQGRLEAILFAGGATLAREGLMVPTRLRQRSSLAAQLGVPAGAPNPVAVNPISIDPMGRTGADGVFAAGDLATMGPQVAAAIAAGSQAAAGVVHSLVAEDYGLEVPGAAPAAAATPAEQAQAVTGMS